MIKLALIVTILIVIYDNALSKVQLSAPHIQGIAVRDPLQFTISWTAIDSGDEEEPVLGYRVHVWETPFVPRVTYKEIDGEMIRVVETPRRRRLRLQKAHFTNYTQIVEGADTMAYTQENIKINITYEIKVQAFTAKSDGALSSPNRFTLH